MTSYSIMAMSCFVQVHTPVSCLWVCLFFSLMVLNTAREREKIIHSNSHVNTELHWTKTFFCVFTKPVQLQMFAEDSQSISCVSCSERSDWLRAGGTLIQRGVLI